MFSDSAIVTDYRKIVTRVLPISIIKLYHFQTLVMFIHGDNMIGLIDF